MFDFFGNRSLDDWAYIVIALVAVPTVQFFFFKKGTFLGHFTHAIIDTVWLFIWIGFIASYLQFHDSFSFLAFFAVFCAFLHFYDAEVEAGYTILTTWGFGRSYLSLKNILVGFAQLLALTMYVAQPEGGNILIVRSPFVEPDVFPMLAGGLYVLYIALVLIHLPIFFKQLRNPDIKGFNIVFAVLADKLSNSDFFKHTYYYIIIEIIFLALIGALLFFFSTYLFGAAWLFVLVFYKFVVLCVFYKEMSDLEEAQLRAYHESGALLKL